MCRAIALLIIISSVAQHGQPCCQPDRSAVDFLMKIEMPDVLNLTLKGSTYVDWKKENIYWGGVGNAVFGGLPNPVTVNVNAGVDGKEQVFWYSLTSGIFSRCESFRINGGIPENLQCVFGQYISHPDNTYQSPDYLGFYEIVTVDKNCIPRYSVVKSAAPVGMLVQTMYENPVATIKEDTNLHEMPQGCTLSGEMTIPFIGTRPVLNMFNKRRLSNRRRTRRNIFDQARMYANRALDNLKDAVNNPDKVVEKVKGALTTGGKVAQKYANIAIDEVRDAVNNPDEALTKVKGAITKGAEVATKVKNAIGDAVNNV